MIAARTIIVRLLLLHLSACCPAAAADLTGPRLSSAELPALLYVEECPVGEKAFRSTLKAVCLGDSKLTRKTLLNDRYINGQQLDSALFLLKCSNRPEPDLSIIHQHVYLMDLRTGTLKQLAESHHRDEGIHWRSMLTIPAEGRAALLRYGPGVKNPILYSLDR